MLLGEVLTPSLLVGFALIFASLVISEYLPLRTARTKDKTDTEPELETESIPLR